MFKLDSPLMTILNKVADILILNIIFIIACVPIVTIGAAFSAAYYIGFKMVKDEESYIVRGFFKAFKDNFKQATIIWLILMVVLGVLFADFRIMAYSGIEFAAWMKVAMGAVTLFVVIGISFVFGLQARYTNTIKNTLRNSFLMALSHLPTAVLLIGVYAVPVLLAYFLPRLMPIYALLAVGGILYFQSFLLLRVFHKYEASLKKIEEEQKEEEQMEEEKI
ncbi:MAG: YesL family protein, partial [Lachnospiraceae bacterium]|nr:YesL family protein [Lachnospiraceae bacterium]